MGFAQVGAFAMILIGVVANAPALYVIDQEADDAMADARRDQTNILADFLDSDITITDTTWDPGPGPFPDAVIIDVENTGTVMLDVETTDFLLDGTWSNDLIITALVDGVDQDLWAPGQTLVVTLEPVPSRPDRAWVVAETGTDDWEAV